MSDREERIGLNGAAAIIGLSPEEVRRLVAEGRLRASANGDGNYVFSLSDVMDFSDDPGGRPSDPLSDPDDEVFEGEVIGDEAPPNAGSSSHLPAVPFERYERLLQQGQDYKTRLEERNRQMEEIRSERDAARTEIDRLWTEIERLNLIEYQRELQEKTISTLEGEKQKLEEERDRITEERLKLMEEKTTVSEEKTRLEAELKVMKSRGFWARLFSGE
ncbi:hypothetical protein [Rubrobacter indicoceani]|uniref:hypothetical protein n=1 Tax=Rubrobacter indicoceani TaxID=2051957 RepID=UPI000E5B03B3|nr:hypothetical protein [Rubrobacter indicoceani]